MVDVGKHAKHPCVVNALERTVKESCEKFLGNLKGTIFCECSGESSERKL